jgi:hypothetical protein
MRIKVGTHNSITGEKGAVWKDILLTPFACCQSKTIKEQLESGVRYFDLRVRLNDNEEWICCHGLWESARTVHDVLEEIHDWLLLNFDSGYVMITYEGDISDIDHNKFHDTVMEWMKWYNEDRLMLTSINVKKPYGTTLYFNPKAPNLRHRYLGLGGATWHTYLPIPWLWKKLYFDEPKLVDGGFTLVDFW